MSEVGTWRERFAASAREAFRRARDGEHPWGSVVVSENPRAQWVRFAVTVYPPGTSLAERRTLQAHRHWWVIGSLLLSVAGLALATYWPPLLAIGAAAAVFFAGVWATTRLTADVRRRCVKLTAGFADCGGRRELLGEVAVVNRTLAAFNDLDSRRESGVLAPVEYELLWAAQYNELVGTHPLPRSIAHRRIRSTS
jgi:hypothetical protein